MGSDEEKEFNTLFKYYEKAIEGRNFHYQNYNTWANYYSIFTGALFIAFYTLETDVTFALKSLLNDCRNFCHVPTAFFSLSAVCTLNLLLFLCEKKQLLGKWMY